MLAALVLPRLLETFSDRKLMVTAGFFLAALTIGHAVYLLVHGLLPWGAFLITWTVSGILYSSILTPSGRLLRRSTHTKDRPTVFASQFALSHACWLLTYPIAGWAGEVFGLPIAMFVLGCLALAGAAMALFVWPAGDPKEQFHEHLDLPPDHPHLYKFHGKGRRHRHVFVIDDEHRVWPTHG